MDVINSGTGRSQIATQVSDKIYYKASALKKYAYLGALLGAVVFSWTWLCWTSWYGWMYGQQPLRMRSTFIGMGLGLPLVLFCVALTAGAVRLLLTNRPAVDVTNEDITHTHVLGITKRVSWSAVGSFRIRNEPAPRRKTNAVLEVLSSGSCSHDTSNNEPHVLMSIGADGLERPLSEIIAILEASVGAYRRRHGVIETRV